MSPVAINFFRSIKTELDLNGPILSFSQQPTGIGSTVTGSVTLSGIATVSFTGISTPANVGVITYKWWEQGVGPLSDGTNITGTGTTQLTLSNLRSPQDNNRKFYLVADYAGSRAGSGSTGTGNALNEPLSSGIATVTVDPLIEIISFSGDASALTNQTRTFTIDASLTDTTYGDVSYQWTLNGVDVNDGVVAVTTTSSTTIPGKIEKTYSSDASLTLPSTATNVRLTVAGAAGGSGGSDAGGGGGAGSQGRVGNFPYASGARTLEFKIGRQGNSGSSGNQNAYGTGGASSYAKGGDGGGAGQNGWSGGGGGGGGASAVYDSVKGGYTIVAAGGGGGGGGSLNRGAQGPPNGIGVGLGFGRVRDAMSNGTSSPDSGDKGVTKNGDGGGGGGGGGGARPSNYPGSGGGGSSGQDNSSGGSGGNGGASGFDTRYASFNYDGYGNPGDGYINIVFDGTVDVPTTTTRRTTISGSKTPTLTLKADAVGVQTVTCRVTSSAATNRVGITSIANFAVLDNADSYVINIEQIGVGTTDYNVNVQNIDLFNGEYEFDLVPNAASSFYSFYSPDKDIQVEMDLYGGKGTNRGSNLGGEGGYSRIRFTMEKNVEYVIAGLSETIKAPFLYKKGTLLACVGAGGNAGTTNRGGFGGGVGVAGDRGRGGLPGTGGRTYDEGLLPNSGIFGSIYSSATAVSPDTKATGTSGGRVLPCPRGVYYRNQGFAACADVGTSVQFRLKDGTVASGTASITRGFKAGYSIIETGGLGSTNGGNGGHGAVGGAGGEQGSGGGGGSGYSNGQVDVISSILGGSDGVAKVVMRVVT